MYYVSILKSVSTARYYIGSTQDLESRLCKHNTRHSSPTKAYRPWILMQTEIFATRREALGRKYQLKRQKSSASNEALFV
jgi:putative endonuclease